MNGIGYIGVLVAVISWGLSKAPMKTKAVRESHTDVMVFQIYNSFFIFIVYVFNSLVYFLLLFYLIQLTLNILKILFYSLQELAGIDLC